MPSWAAVAILAIGRYILFEKTMVGKAVRASADGLEGAGLVGINALRMRFISFLVGGFFGAAGGILLAPLLAFGWGSMFPLVVLGAIGAIGGRWEYVPAALVSIGIGFFSSYAGGYISTAWQDVYVYGALIVILFVLREDKRAGSRKLRTWNRGSSRRTRPVDACAALQRCSVEDMIDFPTKKRIERRMRTQLQRRRLIATVSGLAFASALQIIAALSSGSLPARPLRRTSRSTRSRECSESTRTLRRSTRALRCPR